MARLGPNLIASMTPRPAGEADAGLSNRVLRLRLEDDGSPHSLERALEIARRIQHHQVSLQQRPWALTSNKQFP